MIERIFKQIPQIDQYFEHRRLIEFSLHEEPTNANFFWLVNYVHKHRIDQKFLDQGYKFHASRYRQQWSTTDGQWSSSNDAVRLKMVHPGKVEGLGVSSIFNWSNTRESKNQVESYICVIDFSKEQGAQRIGDLSIDEINKTANPSILEITHRHLDGNDDDFGLETGVLTPNVEDVVRSSYKAMFYFLRDGKLPQINNNLALPE